MFFPMDLKLMPILTNSAFEKNIEDYIVVYDDVLKSDFCDGVVAEFAEEEWRSTQVDESARVDRRIRNADAVSLSTPDVIQKNLGVRKKIEDTLFTACAGILRRYHARFPHSAVVEGMGFELLRYSPGGYYRVHTDSFKRVPRSLACSFTLNNDFEGGEWSFFGGAKVLRPAVGSIVIFPANFMYPHEITEVRNGTRYSIVTWMI